ncbi:hypothetical protein G9A89_003551 [Geosiphon pyriformis]|nr:hypothetical protein G9A89_003551 [Geosiphon pyriformis]
MSVDLEPPNQLSFTRPFTQTVKECLTVSNPNHEPVAFKVKTTAPKQYCVRPNSGRIEAGQSVTVQVVLQPMKEDPPLDYKCKDKFLVQSVAITPDRETLTLPELWAITERQSKELIKENKIRCIYLPPLAPSFLNHTAVQPSSLPSGFNPPPSPTEQFSVPATSIASDSMANSPVDRLTHSNYSTVKESSASPFEKNPISNVERSSAPMNVTNGNDHNQIPPTPTFVGTFPKDEKEHHFRSKNTYISDASSGVDDEATRLRRQLNEAQEEIKRLNHVVENYKQELDTARMRQRKSEEVAEKAGRNSSSANAGFAVRTQEKIPEGYYPFEFIVGAAVAAFLFGVMFF